MQIKLTLEYDGSRYSGWQLQCGQDSVQARIEAALERIFGQPVRVQGAGRTDAGVHALGQVAAFKPPRAFPAKELMAALNALMPPDVAVLEAGEVADGFDPRRDARERIYEYRVLNRSTRSAFEYRYTWLVQGPLDAEAMGLAAQHFIGEHDFAAFRTLGSDEKTTVRRIFVSRWTCEGDRLAYRVEGTAFLRHMVRAMVATMAAVGRGKYAPEFVPMLLKSNDRSLVPAPAPAAGLFLVGVRY